MRKWLTNACTRQFLPGLYGKCGVYCRGDGPALTLYPIVF
ncbi:hypothetical protein BV133_320 [Blastochloris viridis]|uniref:Uncharacterized protein n=1 Tax=Blastochloris viridis TaxID=1079 RepID=A0A182CYA1_BLAVI|nr:hypothetical protein BV133_320 [Blastochloris viridis]